MGVTPRQVARETTERPNVTTPNSPGPAPAQGPVPASSFYMGEDDLFRDPFRDGFPSRR
jgi:hypothetical protein